MEGIMNTINKLFCCVLSLLFCLGLHILSADVLHDFYDGYYTGSPITIQDFDTMTFRTDKSGLPHPTIENGDFSAFPVVPGKSVIFTLLGAKARPDLITTSMSLAPLEVAGPPAVIPPYADWAYGQLNFTDGSISSTILNRGFERNVPYCQVPLATDSSVEMTYSLEILVDVFTESYPSEEFPYEYRFGFYDAWYTTPTPPLTTWTFYDVPINDPGYRHIAASFLSYWDGIYRGHDFEGSEIAWPMDSFFDVFFDIAIPTPVTAVPEPHIYVLLGSLLALAYVVGRKKAKAQC